MVGPKSCCSITSRAVQVVFSVVFVLAFLAVGLSAVSRAQTKPEKQSKAAKSAETTQAPAASASDDSDAKSPDSKDSKEEKPFKGMKYRLIGPFRGGRSLTAAGIPGDPNTYYFGATGGGVWKSTDGAMTWSSVFDKEGSGSIGSLAVANSNPNVVYVGTGRS